MTNWSGIRYVSVSLVIFKSAIRSIQDIPFCSPSVLPRNDPGLKRGQKLCDSDESEGMRRRIDARFKAQEPAKLTRDFLIVRLAIDNDGRIIWLT